jgi:hypothetical protein
VLPRRRRRRRHGDRLRVFETQETTREVRMTISAQVKRERLRGAGQPDTPGHAPAGAIVNLAAENVFVEAAGHAS